MNSLAERKFEHVPELLVSVIDAEEAGEALAGGADLIDIKNPFEGALGTPQPRSVAAIQSQIQGKKPLSVALGDYAGTPGTTAMAALGAAILGAEYVKVAFPPESKLDEIRYTLRLMGDSLALQGSRITRVVAVTYADMLSNADWKLAEFVEYAFQGGVVGCLLDTYVKNGRSLPQVLGVDKIASFVEACHQKGVSAGLAGSLRLTDLPQMLLLRPDILGVRSAACGGDRLLRKVQSSYVKELRTTLYQEWRPQMGSQSLP